MQSGAMQGLIGVDIPHSGDEALLQNEGLELSAAALETVVEELGCEFITQRLGAEVGEHGLMVVDQPNTPEFARVVERQPVVRLCGCCGRIIQIEQQTMVGGDIGSVCFEP